jgi:anti-sigma factor RsiW
MKTPENNDQLHRWLDGEMNPAERIAFEAEMQRDPTLKAEADMMKRIGESLRSHVSVEMPMPNGDFFNSQIMGSIAQLQRAEERAKPGSNSNFRLLDLLLKPWLLIPAAALVVAGFFALQTADGQTTQVVNMYAPNPKVKAQISFSSEAGATVMMLEGLEPMPADKPIAGYNVHHSETDAEMATTTLFGQDGGVLLVMAKDSLDQPRMFVR